MRPQKTPKAGRATRMAARTYLQAHLGWLRGFPLGMEDGAGLEWVCLPRLGGGAAPERLGVTRDLIRSTEYARNAARRRFPQALVPLVGDVEEWARRIDGQLDILKAVVHAGESLPGAERLLSAIDARRGIVGRVLTLRAKWEALEPVIASLAWLHWHDEGGFASALGVLEAHGSTLSDLLPRLEQPDALIVAAQCVQLLEHRQAAGFVALLADRRCWDTPLAHQDFAERLAKSLNRFASGDALDERLLTESLDRPESRLGRDLTSHVAVLHAASETARSRQLRLLEHLLAMRRLAEWEAWWHVAATFEREARGLMHECRHSPRSYAQQARCRELAARIKAELAPPAAISWARISPLLDDICTAADPAAFEAMMGCLPHLAGEGGRRSHAASFLEAWAGAFRSPRRGWGVIVRLLVAQRRILETLGTVSARLIWFRENLILDMIESWIEAGKPQRLIEPAATVLDLLVTQAEDWNRHVGPFADYSGWHTLLDAIEATEDASMTAAMLAAVQPTYGTLQRKSWVTLMRLSGFDAGRFQALAKGWSAFARENTLNKELSLLAGTPETAGLLADALAGGEGKRLSRLIALSSLGRSLGQSQNPEPDVAAASAIDLSLYPAALHDTLLELTRWDANAARAADKILSPDFPQPGRMAAERAWLEEAATEVEGERKAALLARIAKLERRMREPAAVTPGRLRTHRAKLERRLLHARLSNWEVTLLAGLRRALDNEIGAPLPGEWLGRDEVVGLVAALAGLSAGIRKLAFRVLKRRLGPRPWDLREAPANQTFLATLERKGIAAGPWLDGIGVRKITAGGLTLRLDLESDPLEIMRMGEPFQTCLAPGSFNFFSTVANAADINKRVLYARDARGVIRARCLLALADTGHIMTFHVYAHAHHDEIAAEVKAYVLELAGAMKTSIVARGVISRLISPDWYDDGPVDLTGQLNFLDGKSAFHAALKTLLPEELVPSLRIALGDSPITPPVLCLLAQNTTFQQRPELMAPLLPFLGDFSAWDGWSVVTVLPLIRAAGEPGIALALLEAQMGRLPHPDRDHWLVAWLAQEFIALGLPHRALRLIQQTRPAWVKNWRGEDTSRLLVAAEALLRLHRPRRALELYRIAREYGSEEAATRIAAIEGQSGHPA
jgi:hypothetical protein